MRVAQPTRASCGVVVCCPCWGPCGIQQGGPQLGHSLAAPPGPVSSPLQMQIACCGTQEPVLCQTSQCQCAGCFWCCGQQLC